MCLIFSVCISGRNISSLSVRLHGSRGRFLASLKFLQQDGLSEVRPLGISNTVRLWLTLEGTGRGAIAERWVAAAHLPRTWLTSRLAAVQNTGRRGRDLWPHSAAADISNNGGINFQAFSVSFVYLHCRLFMGIPTDLECKQYVMSGGDLKTHKTHCLWVRTGQTNF